MCCEIYREHCKLCGKGYSFHLGDFDTDRFEIALVCQDCLKPTKRSGANPLVWLKNLGVRYCIWSSEKGDYIVAALTDNAWANRFKNHLNEAGTKLLEEIS